jgi:uncharacterized protein YecE (DUF72 family)
VPTSNIRIGLASWTDRRLVAAGFYPSSVRTPKERLRYYTARYPLAEIDSSFHRLPSTRVTQLWADRTPPGFVFNVKAFRLFTQHPTAPDVVPGDLDPIAARGRNLYYRDVPEATREELWSRFYLALEPLAVSGRLGAVHLQFPPWFVARRDNYEHLRDVRDRVGDLRLAIELRHASWFDPLHAEATLDFLRHHGLVHVVVVGAGLVVPWEVTQPALAVVRVYGNGDDGNAPRDDAHVGAASPESLAHPLRALAARVDEVHVVFTRDPVAPQRADALMRRLGDVAVAPAAFDDADDADTDDEPVGDDDR